MERLTTLFYKEWVKNFMITRSIMKKINPFAWVKKMINFMIGISPLNLHLFSWLINFKRTFIYR